MTATKKTNADGKMAWEWMQGRCPKWGSLIVPEAKFPYGPQPEVAPLTVGEMESACGMGALAAAKKYCQQLKVGISLPPYPYAARIENGYLRVIPDGEEIDSDAVLMRYPVCA